MSPTGADSSKANVENSPDKEKPEASQQDVSTQEVEELTSFFLKLSPTFGRFTEFKQKSFGFLICEIPNSKFLINNLHLRNVWIFRNVFSIFTIMSHDTSEMSNAKLKVLRRQNSWRDTKWPPESLQPSRIGRLFMVHEKEMREETQEEGSGDDRAGSRKPSHMTQGGKNV